MASRQASRDLPARRSLRVFAGDPMIQGELGGPLLLDVPYERLSPGPIGERLAVVDYDAAERTFYEPVNLDDPVIAMQGGLAPSEGDPRFHQQMVYAVAARVLETFDAALGRRIRFLRDNGIAPLRLLPHAFQGANAFYDPGSTAILFGYYRASGRGSGRHQPGQIVFTCLSHDIIAHEMTHAVLDRIKRYFREPTRQEALAFHEGFADAATILHQLSIPELLSQAIARYRGDLRAHGFFSDLAEQFAVTSGAGAALRSVVDRPDPGLLHRKLPIHERGAVLAAAIFAAFVRTYEARTRDLLRIATGGRGLLPEGELSGDLVGRLAKEAATAARSVLEMCIRALEYTAPVDITFGDYLRALVTADREIHPADPFGQRRALIDEFLRRGLYVEGVRYPAEDALCWDAPDSDMELPPDLIGNLFLKEAARAANRNTWAAGSGSKYACALREYAEKHQEALRLVDVQRHGVEVVGFHASFRADTFGQPVIELVAQLVQKGKDDVDGALLLGGTTIVARLGEGVRHVIYRRIPSREDARSRRREEREALLDALSAADPLCARTRDPARWQRLLRLAPFLGARRPAIAPAWAERG
jgi:hypothetical protein